MSLEQLPEYPSDHVIILSLTEILEFPVQVFAGPLVQPVLGKAWKHVGASHKEEHQVVGKCLDHVNHFCVTRVLSFLYLEDEISGYMPANYAFVEVDTMDVLLYVFQ